MRQLATPVPVRTRYGIVQATHQLHSVRIDDGPNGLTVQSTKTLCVDVDGKPTEIQEGSESIGLTIADLPENFTLDDIATAHDAVASARRAKAVSEAEAQAARLQQQITEGTEALARLRAEQEAIPAPVVKIGS